MDWLSALGAIGAGLQMGQEQRRKRQIEEEERAYQKVLRDRQAQEWARRQKEWSREDAAQPELDAYNAALRKSKLKELQDAETNRNLNAFSSYVKPFSSESDDGMTETVSVPAQAPLELANRAMALAGGPGLNSAMLGNQRMPTVQPFQVSVPTDFAKDLAKHKAQKQIDIDMTLEAIGAGARRDPNKAPARSGGGSAKAFRMTEQQKKEFEAEVSSRVSAEIGENFYTPQQIDAIKKKHAWNVYREKFGGGNATAADAGKASLMQDFMNMSEKLRAEIAQQGGQR